MVATERIKIILVNIPKIMCDGLKALFKSQPDMEVIGEAQDFIEAIQVAHELEPDVIVIEVNMIVMKDIDSIRQIFEELPEIKIIALSMYPRKTLVTELLKVGVSGYMLKDHNFQELKKAIYSVIKDNIYLSSKITNDIVDNYVRCRPGGRSFSDKALTDREQKVLELLADGKSSKEIARIIDMSVKTVDARRRKIMHKLGIESTAELVKYAIRMGITTI